MKFGKKKAGAIAAGLSLVMALSPVAAFADPITPKAGTQSAQVKKVLVLNEGSTVDATFKFNAEPVQLTVQGTGDNEEKTAPTNDVPAATINDISFSSTATGDKAEKAGNNEATADITVVSFPHAGYFAWKVTEVNGTDTNMQYNTGNDVYTLIAQVSNDGTVKYVLVDGEATTVTNTNKAGSADFTNKYTEPANGNKDAGLTIEKKVEGNQVDVNEKYEFTVTFTAPTVLPAGIADATAYFNQLGISGASDVVWEATNGARTGKVTFNLKKDEKATFSNLIAGTKYTVSEASKPGFTQSYEAKSNGVEQTENKQTNQLIGEKENTGKMTNTHNDITPTGLVINNMPYIVMAGAAVAGVVAYGSAKRKLQK